MDKRQFVQVETGAVPTVLLARRFMMHAQLVAQSRVDTKTGLLNASTWEREAATEIARAIRTKSPLALALVDIDHFKLVNDTYGHLAGDKALRAVTDALRNQLRAYDLAGRFGGEEFAILLLTRDERWKGRTANCCRNEVPNLANPRRCRHRRCRSAWPDGPPLRGWDRVSEADPTYPDKFYPGGFPG